MHRALGVLCILLLVAPALAQDGAPDLSTPRRGLKHYVDAARAGDWGEAARALDLREIPASQGADTGPRRARALKFVLDERLWLDWEKISDSPDGDLADGPGVDVVGNLGTEAAPLPLRMVRGPEGAWRIDRGTVAAVPRLYAAYGPGWVGEHVPPVLVELRFMEIMAWQWIGLALAAVLAAFVGLVLGTVAVRIALRVARRTRFEWDDRLVLAASGPARLLVALAVFALAARSLHLAVPAQLVLSHLLRIATTGTFVWIAIRAVAFFAHVAEERLGRVAPDEGSARARKTQVMMLRRIADVVVFVIGAALVLLQFDAMRSLGTSLLASAGVAGIVVGLAAQRSIATLLAGLQLSFTQPIRVGDVVVIEGEWGRIEEITLTYVVVKIWDLRRLVVPMSKIFDAPFQNWTRTGSDIMGTVFVYADHRVPVDAVRGELDRFVRTRAEWDGKVVGLQVTEASDRSVELRALVSSDDSGKNWDLRCAVREHLVSFLQALEGGRYLPRVRLEGHEATPARNVARGPPALGERPLR
jgi:small-conductance mechanosensitive channel